MTTRTITRFYDAALGRAGLRATGYAILSRLERDGPLRIGDLAARLALDRTTCSRELRPLVDAGLIELEPGTDRRRRVATLSPAGRDRLDAARPHWRRAQRDVAAAFGADRTEELLTGLRGLLATGPG